MYIESSSLTAGSRLGGSFPLAVATTLDVPGYFLYLRKPCEAPQEESE
jgi:hypothetical protein